MLRPHRCVSVHCDQCADTPEGPGFEAHYSDETAALDAARAAGWLAAPDGRLLCSACGPVLVCEAEGHEFTGWRRSIPGPGDLSRTCQCDPARLLHLLGSADCGRQFRYCRRCCLHESRTTSTLGEVA